MKSVKRNGFDLPFHHLQVASWVSVLLLSSLFYSVIGVNLEGAHRIVILTAYSLAFALCLTFGFICTQRDPSDTAVKMKYIHKNYASEFSSSLFPRLCTRCNTHVGALSKHCNKCNRCTEKFDHHCDWLNNCIGGPNYRFFVMLLVTLESWVGMQLVVTFYIMLAVFRSGTLGSEVLAKYSISDNGYCYIIMLLITSVLCVMIAVGNGYLIVFHAWLKWKGLTTYEFIVARRQRKCRVEQNPDVIFSHRKSENSSVVVELNLSGGEGKVDYLPELRDHHEATPSIASEFELKKLFSRTIDNSSLPSQDKVTDLDFSTIAKRRKARDSIFGPGEEVSADDNLCDSPDLPTRYKTGPLPLRPDFP